MPAATATTARAGAPVAMSKEEIAARWEQRVFSFVPASQRPPLALTAAQRQEYDADGFVRRVPVFTPEEMRPIRERIDRLLQVFAEAGRNSYAMDGHQANAATLYDLVLEPRILDYVEDLLGPDVVCWGSHCFCKLPGDGKTVSWHQDAPYWGMSPAHTVTVWLAIDDVDAENGSLQVLPGSHREGAIPMRPSAAEENNVLWLTTEGYERFGTPYTTVLRAGEASIHSDLLVHGSGANHSSRRRCALALRYASCDVQAIPAPRPGSIHCRGADPTGHWPHHLRPLGEDPFATPIPALPA